MQKDTATSNHQMEVECSASGTYLRKPCYERHHSNHGQVDEDLLCNQSDSYVAVLMDQIDDVDYTDYPRDAQRVRLPVIVSPDCVASSKQFSFCGEAEKQGKPTTKVQ